MSQKSLCQRVADLVSSAPERAENLPAELVEHIEKCALCQIEVRASQRLVSLLKEHHADYSPSITPEELAERAMAGRKQSSSSKNRNSRGGGGFWSGHLRLWAPMAAAALVAAVVFVFFYRPKGPDKPKKSEPTPSLAAESCVAVSPDGETNPRDCHHKKKGVISTERDERLRVTLSDKTVIQLNHSSLIELTENERRSFSLLKGEALIETVPQKELPSLMVSLPTGSVEVVGTKLHVKAQGDYSIVDVVRGKVMVEANGKKEPLLAGGEAVLEKDRNPTIQPASDLGVALEWIDEKHGQAEGTGGFGTLTARRPGSSKDEDEALRLVDHKVRVKMRGQMVRTEIEEEFYNDSNHTMEGIYKFPLPSDAKIAALDLVVKGEWMHGAVVERKRGDKIWRGVIRQATPKKKQKKREEFVWVPGPWKDPAILKWQHGNQFELRIYPIPKKGSRKVRIAYTQVMRPIPGGRRFVLPLAADPSGKPRSERFDLQVSIGGLSDTSELRISPYDLKTEKKKDGVVLKMQKDNFAPKGDIVLDIPDARPAREVHAYSYKDPTRKSDGFALLSLRPRIPYKTEGDKLDVLFVVDSSYSIQKARLKRAAEIIKTLTGEMGLESRVALLSCATRCRPLTPRFMRATTQNGTLLKQKVEELEPLGSARMGAAFQEAASFLKKAGASPANSRIIYLGDGIPTVGEIETDRLAAQVKNSMGEIRLTMVSLGGHVDELNMKALAKAGGGSFVPYPAGANIRSIAFTTLQRQWAEPLRGAGLLLPTGVADSAPAKLDEVWPGEEKLIAVRVSKDTKGEVVLTGEMQGETFERRYDISFRPRPNSGNAFLPRLWAEMRISDLEQSAGRADRDKVVELSKRYHVLSRHTSLLVLESQAMAKAFGVEDTRPSVEWTGDGEIQEEETEVLSQEPGTGKRGLSSGADDRLESLTASKRKSRRSASALGGGGGFDSSGFSKDSIFPKKNMEAPLRSRPRRPRPMIRMKRVWYRVADIGKYDGPGDDEKKKLEELRSEFEKNPHSRDRTRDLLRWYIRAGKLKEAEETAHHWLKKDRLDAGALVELAGIYALRGHMEKSRELLASAVDVDPRNSEAHTRMIELYKAADKRALMCDHALTRAIVDPQKYEYAVSAVRCNGDRKRHFADLDRRHLRRAEKSLKKEQKTPKSLWDRLVVKGKWRGTRNVDIVVITPRGRVVSWMGGARRVKSRHPLSTEQEILASSMWERGLYQIVLVPVGEPNATDQQTAVNGSVEIQSYKSKKSIPFSSNGEPIRLASVRVKSKSKLVRAP